MYWQMIPTIGTVIDQLSTDCASATKYSQVCILQKPTKTSVFYRNTKYSHKNKCAFYRN